MDLARIRPRVPAKRPGPMRIRENPEGPLRAFPGTTFSVNSGPPRVYTRRPRVTVKTGPNPVSGREQLYGKNNDLKRSNQMKGGIALCLAACAAALPFAAMAGSPSGARTISAVQPAWTIGDWWTVESQRFDHGENRAGAAPGWLEKETWRFSVDATNPVDGVPCYEVSVKPEGKNQCPYWFVYSFRKSDLLVMRRELHQPPAGKTGRAASAPVVVSSYAADDQAPFVPDDFPNLPITTPHFAGDATNSYTAPALPKNGQPRAGLAPTCSRSTAGSLTQTFHPGEYMDFVPAAGMNLPATSSGVITLAASGDKFERQSWDRNHPWHLYSEKWDSGELVRKSWLLDSGHAGSSPTAPQSGGAR